MTHDYKGYLEVNPEGELKRIYESILHFTEQMGIYVKSKTNKKTPKQKNEEEKQDIKPRWTLQESSQLPKRHTLPIPIHLMIKFLRQNLLSQFKKIRHVLTIDGTTDLIKICYYSKEYT